MRLPLPTLILLTLAWTMPVAAAPDGAKLYARHCAACHGENGTGGIGVPLSLPSFQATVSNDYLRKSIQFGRPGRVMPPAGLNPAEIDAVVRYIRSWAIRPRASQFDGSQRVGVPLRGKAPAPRYPDQHVKGNAEHGRALYAEHCASCHGASGEGGKGTGVTFSRPRDQQIMAPALNNAGFLASASDFMIRENLIKGRADTPMTSFLKKGLLEKDIDDIVSFVRSFEKTAPAKNSAMLEIERATLTVESPYDLNTTIENVKRAATSNNFVFIREQRLDHGLAPESQEDPRQHIIYFCNFGFLNAALATDPRVGLFLPCRITVVEQQGKVRMMSINPKRLSKIFNNAELNTMCDELTRQYLAIMEEAAL